MKLNTLVLPAVLIVGLSACQTTTNEATKASALASITSGSCTDPNSGRDGVMSEAFGMVGELGAQGAQDWLWSKIEPHGGKKSDDSWKAFVTASNAAEAGKQPVFETQVQADYNDCRQKAG